MTDNTNGRKYARFTLVVTLLISVIANVTHAVLADSAITLWLRVPGAAVWPVLSFLAIEVIVRIIWTRSVAHYLARLFVLGPAIPAVIVSYEHQQRLLTMMGENALVSAIGPIAIDGLMIGCTLALLFTRPAPESAQPARGEAEPEAEPVPTPEEMWQPTPMAPIEPAALADEAFTPVARLRASRSNGHARLAVKALQDGATTAEAVAASEMSAPAVRKYGQVIRILRDNPHAPVDTRKMGVRAEVVDEIRAWARLESVR